VDQLFMGEDALNIFEPDAINTPFQKEFPVWVPRRFERKRNFE
jgi:hypothetical protein